MMGWIGAVLALFVVQTLIAPSIQYLGGAGSFAQKVGRALGPRDAPPPASKMVERADRALKNMMEALPVFLTLGLLCMVTGKSGAVAVNGAMVFFGARLVYVPSYLIGVPGLRSIVWVVGSIGLGMMICSLAAD